MNQETSFLFKAIQTDQFEIFQMLIQVPKININQMVVRYEKNEKKDWPKFIKKKRSILCFAMDKNKIEFAEVLIKMKNLKINQECNNQKETYLHATDDINFVKLLLSREDLDVNQIDRSNAVTHYSKLQLACIHGNSEMLKLLLERKGLDVNAPCQALGHTPLILAGMKGHIEVVKLLLSHAYVQKNAKNYAGQTALSLATNKEIKQLIRNHAPKRPAKKRRMN